MTHIEHIFGINETIVAIIRKYNGMNISKDQIKELVDMFNQLNGRVVPKPGNKMKIPLQE